jgi:hypothetical protein
MTTAAALIGASGDKDNQMAKTVSSTVTILYIILFVLAIYLAIRDMKFLPNTSSKIWLLLLAVLLPELTVILHGLSSSSQGIGFFDGSPLPGSGGMSPSAMPQSLSPMSVPSLGTSLGSSMM